MSIAGTLRTMSIADVVQWLGTSHKTGTLVVEGPRATKQLVFRAGRVVAVASDDPREMLGSYLVGWGYLSEDELQYFLAMQEHFQIMLGELLVRLNHLARVELDRVLRVKTEESLFDLLAWEEGSFRFVDGELPERDFVEVELPVASCLLEGYRQRDERRRMSALVPDARHVPRWLGPFAPSTAQERAIAAAVDGERSIERMALACRLPEFDVLAFVFEAVSVGRMAVDPPPVADGGPAGLPRRWLELEREAEESLRRGRLLDALRAIERLEEELPPEPGGVPASHTLRRRLEEELDRSPLAAAVVLEPALGDDKLLRLDCDPAAGFVLSRVTGRYSTEEVLRQLPGSRLGNRVLLHDLLRRKLVKVRDATSVSRYRQADPLDIGEQDTGQG